MRSHSIAAASRQWWWWWCCCCCCLLLTLPSVLSIRRTVAWDEDAQNFTNFDVTATEGDTVDIEVPDNHTVACVWNERSCVVKEDEDVQFSREENGERVYTYTVKNSAALCFFADLELCEQGVRGVIKGKATEPDRRPRLSEEGMVIAALVVLAMACIMAFIIRFCARHYNPPRRIDPEVGTEGWFSQLWARRIDEEPPPPYIKEEPKPPPYAELSSVSAITGEASTSGSSTALASTSPSPMTEVRSAVPEDGSVPSAGSSASAQPDVADVQDAKPIRDASDENMNAMTPDASTPDAANVSANASGADARASTTEGSTSDASDTNAASSSTAPPSYTA